MCPVNGQGMETLHFLHKNMSKKVAGLPLHDVYPFDKLYLPLYLHNIIPELGSTLGYCIEAMSIPVETAEDPYAPKTSLQRAGQYLKVQCAGHRVRQSKRLKEKCTPRRCLTGPNMHEGLRLNSGISMYHKTELPLPFFVCKLFFARSEMPIYGLVKIS
jgi:hypothetical protein